MRLYEPVSSVEREVRLSPLQRVALLDSADEWRLWIARLDRRLSLRRRAGGAFGVHLSQARDSHGFIEEGSSP